MFLGVLNSEIAGKMYLQFSDMFMHWKHAYSTSSFSRQGGNSQLWVTGMVNPREHFATLLLLWSAAALGSFPNVFYFLGIHGLVMVPSYLSYTSLNSVKSIGLEWSNCNVKVILRISVLACLWISKLFKNTTVILENWCPWLDRKAGYKYCKYINVLCWKL